MVKRILSIFVIAGTVLFFFTNNAYANIGLPMIFLGIPFLVIAFIPVFVIEMFVYQRVLNISWKRCAIGSFWANVLTTIIGYPISWILHVAVGMAFGYPLGYLISKFHNIDWLSFALFPFISAWLMPNVDQWMIYLAGIFGLIPAFWISVKIEGNFLKKQFEEREHAEVKKTAYKANQVTYLLLASFLGAMSLYHGLIKLHAFDFLRDRSDERVVFNSKLTGDILVSSDSEMYSLNLEETKKEIILSNNLKEIYGKEFQNSAFGKDLAWFTIGNYDIGRHDKLYRYDINRKILKEISLSLNINKIISVKDVAFVFIGDSYISKDENQTEEGIFRISNDGQVQKVFNDGLMGSEEAGFISPSGDKIATLTMKSSKDLNVFKPGPFLVQAELRVHDLNSKENIKIADLWEICRYKSVDNFKISWNPSNGILYFINIEFTDGVDAFFKSVDFNDLKKRFGKDEVSFNPEETASLLKELSINARKGIYEYNFLTKTVKKFIDGVGILGWNSEGNLIIIEKSLNKYELFDFKNGKIQPVHFNHLKEGKISQIAWSKDGKFIAYFGDSEHFLDKHYYNEGMYWNNRPAWVWIKELDSGKERKFDLKPINPAKDILWR